MPTQNIWPENDFLFVYKILWTETNKKGKKKKEIAQPMQTYFPTCGQHIHFPLIVIPLIIIWEKKLNNIRSGHSLTYTLLTSVLILSLFSQRYMYFKSDS